MSKQQTTQAQGTVRDPLVSVEEVSRLFGLSEQYFYKNTDIPRYQMRERGSIRFDVEQVRAYFHTKK